MGNGEAKELICVTHGHELRWGNASRGVQGGGEWRGGKKWDNCNRIINKTYLKIRKSKKTEKIFILISKPVGSMKAVILPTLKCHY